MLHKDYNTDLSFDKTTIRLSALIYTAQIACAATRNNMQSAMNETYSAKPDRPFMSGVDATSLVENAKQFQIANEVLHALLESKTRTEFVLVKE